MSAPIGNINDNGGNNFNSSGGSNIKNDGAHGVVSVDDAQPTFASTGGVMVVESGGIIKGWQPPPSPWGESSQSHFTANTVCNNIVIASNNVCDPPAPLTDIDAHEEGPPPKKSPRSFLSSSHAPQNVPTALGEMPDVLLLPPLVPPPDTKVIFQFPKMESDGNSVTFVEDTSAWGAFLDLKKKTEEATARMMSFYDQVTKLQLTHEQEAASYRESAEGIINQQRKALDTASFDCNELRSNNEMLRELLEKKSQELVEYEKANYDLNMRIKKAEQRCVHVEDRATVAENGRRIAEIRCKELEMSLEHTTELVKSLRVNLREFIIDRERALQEQYRIYEENRKETINYYNEREKKMLNEFNDVIKKNHEIMFEAVKKREEQLSKSWQDIMNIQQQQHEECQRQTQLIHEKEMKDHHANTIRMEQDKERWYDQQRNEMVLLEQRYKEREQHVLVDIARRERELGEREQRMRVLRAQEEQDFKVAFMAKEAELKAYYQKITEDIRLSFDKEREKLVSSFREQVQELSQLHLNNERELERMHREKEREMAQRYRICGYELDDRKGEADLRNVSLQAQSALLSKFDAIEMRQRERAEKARASFLKTTHVADSPSCGEENK